MMRYKTIQKPKVHARFNDYELRQSGYIGTIPADALTMMHYLQSYLNKNSPVDENGMYCYPSFEHIENSTQIDTPKISSVVDFITLTNLFRIQYGTRTQANRYYVGEMIEPAFFAQPEVNDFFIQQMKSTRIQRKGNRGEAHLKSLQSFQKMREEGMRWTEPRGELNAYGLPEKENDVNWKSICAFRKFLTKFFKLLMSMIMTSVRKEGVDYSDILMRHFPIERVVLDEVELKRIRKGAPKKAVDTPVASQDVQEDIVAVSESETTHYGLLDFEETSETPQEDVVVASESEPTHYGLLDFGETSETLSEPPVKAEEPQSHSFGLLDLSEYDDTATTPTKKADVEIDLTKYDDDDLYKDFGKKTRDEKNIEIEKMQRNSLPIPFGLFSNPNLFKNGKRKTPAVIHEFPKVVEKNVVKKRGEENG